jgi:hypothetical protein
VDLDKEMEELDLYFESEFEVIGDEDFTSATSSSQVQAENTETVHLKTEDSTDNTRVNEVNFFYCCIYFPFYPYKFMYIIYFTK